MGDTNSIATNADPNAKTQPDLAELEYRTKRLDADIKELDVATKQFDLKTKGSWSGRIASPLLPIVVTAACTFVFSQLASCQQQRDTLSTELITKAIATNDPRESSRNLLFYLDLGLIADKNGKIADLRVNPWSAPFQGSVPSEPRSLSKFLSLFEGQFGDLKAGGPAALVELFDLISRDQFVADIRQVSLLLALVRQETSGSYSPRIEQAPDKFLQMNYGADTPTGRAIGNTTPADAVRYKGRGYIQITGRRLYDDIGTYLGVNLLEQPERMLEPSVAYKAMKYMVQVRPRPGRKLSDFVSARLADYAGAVDTIRGRGGQPNEQIALDAIAIEGILRQALSSPNQP